jgi:single-strand DNA-binding protein
MINRVILIGRLTKDVEVRHVGEQQSVVASFTLAVERSYQKEGREKQSDFFRIIAWGKLGERCAEFISKGTLVAVEGTLQMRQWENKEGATQSIVEVRADIVQFLDRPVKKRTEEATDEPPAAPKPETGKKDYGSLNEGSNLDDDIDLTEDPF